MWVVFIAVLVALVSFGHPTQDNPTPDGRMWANFGTASQQGTYIKAAYVRGVSEGLRAGVARGYASGRLYAGDDAVNYVKQCGHPCPDIAHLFDGKGLAEGLEKVESEVNPRHASALDIVHRMDMFYSDYKNTPVCVIVAVQESIKSLNGKASSERDLEMMRQQGCH